MYSKNRIKKLLNFEETDRVGLGEEYWDETIKRWYNEGLPKDIPEYEYFNLDYWFLMFEQRFGFEERVIENMPEYRIIQHIDGGIFKVLKGRRHFVNIDVDMPGIPLDYKIKSKKDWDKYKNKFIPQKWRLAYKPKLSPNYYTTPDSISDLRKLYKKLKKLGKFIFFGPREQVENIRSKLGTENFLLQLVADPKWMMEMFEADLNLTIGMFNMFEDIGIKFDGCWFWGDIAYKNGGLFSPSTYKKIISPFHRRLFSYCREKNLPVVYHTDGNINDFIHLLLEDGITALQPLEVKAGMDAIKLKKKYGKNLSLIGNIDARVMSKSKFEIENEIRSKIPFLKKGGGYIYHSDHSVPDNVSLENYKYVLNCAKKYGSYG